ncbi:MAG TPA: glycosyltransferase [Chlamydiales bacterium]|nr:glycosyltransferase [Chlamydiales bacterium]
MKIALVHDWLVSIGGGEKVLEAILQIFPSPIYTLVKDEMKLQRTSFAKSEIISSLIQKLPFAKKAYRNYLPLFPFAIEQFDLSSYDVVLSTSHCAAKGVLTHSDQVHICYCFTPLRYGWDLYHQYIEEAGLKKGVKGFLAKFFIHYLRIWDYQASQRVDAFLAISHYVKRRIKKTYGRSSEVIYPPVDVDYFGLSENKEDFYLTASRMVPYKKMDLIVEAFAAMPDKKLLVIGDGPDKEKIKAKAKKNIEFLGDVTDEEMKSYLQRAKAFVFAAIEDFGIVPIEAMATGTPVIALGKGGCLETVKEGISGLFFPEQTVSSLQEAVMKFEKVQDNFHPKKVRDSVLSFNKERFQKEIKAYVEKSACKLSY